MNVQTHFRRLFAFVMLCGLALAGASCRRNRGNGAAENVPHPAVVAELEANRIGDLPGAVYQGQAQSPIYWQPWTKATFDRAKEMQRLVLCVIAMPQQPGYLKTLEELAADPETVAIINNEYVPVLVDGDASRELGLLAADLCVEIKSPLALPLFVWMTHEANPVTWIPAPPSQSKSAVDLFRQSHATVSQMWEEDVQEYRDHGTRGYVLKNSASNNAIRRSKFEGRRESNTLSAQPVLDVVRSLRQLVSLYDPYSRSFDQSGGLFPASSLELLASASVRPGLSPELRERCLETTRDLLSDLLPSAMFDPLEGGVFSSRRGGSWALPSFVRDCPTQSKVAMMLINAYRATGEERALERARELISFAEKSFQTPDGLFAVGLSTEPDPEDWVWSVEEIESVLGPEDAPWWIEATRMKGLGNLPMEADPRREFFRQNTVGLSKSVAQIAAELSVPVESFEPRFEAAKAKLLEVRNQRIGELPRDDIPHFGASFRMVSAYAAVYGATGEEAYREKAIELLERSREAFTDDRFIRAFPVAAPPSVGAGRAFHYALALQSALDVAAINGEETWLAWAEDLATTAAELFTGNGFLKECSDDAKLIDLPISDSVMLFDDSTAGLVSLAECRLSEMDRPLLASFSELATPLPTQAVDLPILHSDLLLATMIRHYRMTVIYGGNIPEALKSAVARLPLRTVQRRVAGPKDDVPAESVKIMLPNGRSTVVSTPEALQEALLPSSEK